MDNLGLNQFLQPISSPIAQNQGVTTAYEFNSEYERSTIYNTLVRDGAITSAKIVNLDASKINAGTVVVALNLGAGASGSLVLDGANNRIVVNDGTTNRIVIGSV